jgi:formylglycine-generating enzyme required for sulfatase activity
MVTIPAGPFMMGCNQAVDSDCDEWEHPYHEVNVPAFEIDRFEVTVYAWRACVAAGVCEPQYGCELDLSADHPAVCLLWHMARRYCAWLGKRLCTEAEWEKAARGTDGRKYPWGNERANCTRAVMSEGLGSAGCGADRVMPVGSKPLGASPYGVLDMAGNAAEWVEDDWHLSYSDAGRPDDGSAWLDAPRSPYRSTRGGSFGSDLAGVRTSSRQQMSWGSLWRGLGLRCCRTR